jgi:hypothetical protein
MYFSAEHLALATQAVRETFQQCSVAWQAIPHWDTGDPGQLNVANGLLGGSANFLTLAAPPPPPPPSFQLTVAEAIAPTPDALVTAAMSTTTTLATNFDTDVLQACFKKPTGPNAITFKSNNAQDLQDGLINARVQVENNGYRAPSCLVTNTVGLQELNHLANGYYNLFQQILAAANINSLYRFDPLDGSASGAINTTKARMLFIGRRRRIAQGGAPQASPGEEPVDLAVSVMPSLEVDGETGGGTIQLSPRIRYATRITDATGLVALKE